MTLHDPDNYLHQKIYAIVKDRDVVRQIMDEIDNVCQHCFDAEHGCKCWDHS